MDNNKLWKIADVQNYLQVKSRKKIYGLINEGLPTVKIGRLLRFKPESVINFFNEQEK